MGVFRRNPTQPDELPPVPPVIRSNMGLTLRNGFTLLELMVTLLLFSIILTVGVPTFREFTLTNQMATRVNALVSDLTYARNEAVKRNLRVTTCKSANPTAALASCASSGGWEQGRILFVDADANGQRDSDELLLRASEPFADGSTLRGNANVQDRVTYIGTGRVLGSNGSLIFCDARITNFSTDKSKARVVVISNTGRVRTEAGDGSTLTSCTPSS